MKIRVQYSSIDGYRETKVFKTLAGAQRYAHKYVGAHPEIGSSYAISGDGVGKIMVEGVTEAELFPDSTAFDMFPTDNGVDDDFM
jgi:hypothetical protein